MRMRNFADHPKTVNLAIKLNLDAESSPCPLCDKPTNPNIGAELMLAENLLVVCRDCGYVYAPVLVALLDLGQASTNFYLLENEFGSSWQEDF